MNAVLRKRSGPGKGNETSLENLPFIIGRGDHCDLRLGSPMVSRTHCQVESMNQQLVVRDLESKNGTFVNDVRITTPHLLLPGDVLRVGLIAYYVDLVETPEGETVAIDSSTCLHPVIST